MSETLVFVHCDQQQAETLAVPYRDRGWRALAAPADSTGTIELIAEERPLAAVFCLDGPKAFDACSLAESILYDQRGIRPLLIFVGGTPEDVETAKSMVPVGVLVKPDELPWVLKRLSATV
jgi:hypothetical protein